jgi:phosphoglucosamine mutase
MEHLFGTDGIRGEVGKYPLTQEALFDIGRTLGLWLKEQYPQRKRLKLLIGKDTRQSGSSLELALLKGAKHEGIEALRAGVCPSPSVAYLTRALGVNLGVAVSASHNPCTDNGIKFFAADGYKLFPAAEKRIEEIFFNLSSAGNGSHLKAKDLPESQDALSLYLDFAKNFLGGLSLSGLKVVVDCAFGSFSKIAPEVLQSLGARVVVLNNQPDGKNINVDCGTLYPQAMAQEIRRCRADMGIAFDGDGDRVIVADEKANILDGDYILAILAKYLLGQKRLAKHTVVCTQMSNIGLELYLKQLGVQTIRTAVGDKYVLQEMLKSQASLGGEQSGHIILLEHTTTGDGLVAALELVKVMLRKGQALSRLAQGLQKFPQVLVNVKVKEKKPLEQIEGLNEALERCHSQLGNRGRVLVRYSGTENLARIMIEGERHSCISRIAGSLAKIIEEAAGE